MDGDVKCKDLTEETGQTLNGEEQFVMFDTEEGKRALLSVIADYIMQHGEIGGVDIPTLLNGKVDKEEGKSLTENDYTDADKTKVDTLPYTGTAPITVTGSAITHDDSGATAGAYGDTSNQTPGFGSKFKVPSFTVDAKGHLTVAGEHTVKIPDATASTVAPGLMSQANLIQLVTNRNNITSLQAMIAPTEENGEAAHQSYAGGEYLIVDNTLYHTPQSINQGDTIDKSHLNEVTVGAALFSDENGIDSVAVFAASILAIFSDDITEAIGSPANNNYSENGYFMAYDSNLDAALYQAATVIEQGDILSDAQNGNCFKIWVTDILSLHEADIEALWSTIDADGIQEILYSPDEDGTYTFKCIVEDGEPTYFWEAE